MEKALGFHVPFPLLKMKISTIDLTPSVSKARKVGSLASQLFCCILMILERQGYAYPEVLNFLAIWYHEMIDWLRRPAHDVPRQPLPPWEVSISMKPKEVVEAKYKNAGVQKGNYIMIHGIQSDSKASMQCRGDTDSLLPLEIWDEITSVIRVLTPVFVIPHEKERENV